MARLRSGRSVLAVAALAAIAFAMLFALGSLTASPDALASSVHLKGGKHATPSFMDNGLTLTVSGELSGLGEGDVVVTLDATANATATCTNHGGNQAPGQNPAPVDVQGATTLDPDDREKNGNTPFRVMTEAPATPISGAPDCPNPNWTEEITDLAFTSVTITVEQGGTDVLTVGCTFKPPTSNGAVPKGSVSCQ